MWDASLIEQFLSQVWRPVGYGEIRVIDPRKPQGDRDKVKQRFFDLSEGGYSVVVPHVEALMAEGGVDIYFGVIPRLRPKGTAADAMPFTDVVWADIDAKHHGGKAGAWSALSWATVWPSIVVDSGRGYHAYWLFRELVPFEDAHLAMRSIAKRVGGDHTYDAARVLRVPGTTNYKDPEDLMAVRIVDFRGRRYRWADFEVDVQHEMERTTNFSPARVALQRDGLPDWLEELIRDGAPQGQRSEAAFKVCLWLARFGWSDSDITAAFINNPGGIGAKYHERRDGDRWLALTIRSARSRA